VTDSGVNGTALDPRLRQRLALLSDLIAPRHGRMPAASEVDVAGSGMDAVLDARPDLLVPLTTALAQCPDAVAADHLERLAQADPAALAVLLQVVAGAYYMHPRVRGLIGYEGQQEIPVLERSIEVPTLVRVWRPIA
jgi:hypothetical protein